LDASTDLPYTINISNLALNCTALTNKHSLVKPGDFTACKYLSHVHLATPIGADYGDEQMKHGISGGGEAAVGADSSRPPPIYRPL
jgi:hypothetical protein